MDVPLAAGAHSLAIGVWLNQSFAENNPDADPTLSDGFIGLGVPNGLGSSYYEIKVTTPAAVPEPAMLCLTAIGIVALARRRAHGRVSRQ